MDNKKLYKNKQDTVLAGVCSGLAEHLNMDVSLVRILSVVVFLFTGSTIAIVYIVMAIVLPDKSEVLGDEAAPYNENDNDNKKEDDLYEYDEDEYKL